MEFFHFFLDISSVIKATPGVCLLYLLFPHPKFFFRSGIHRGNIVLSYFEGRSFTVYVCPTYTCPFVYMSNWKKKTLLTYIRSTSVSRRTFHLTSSWMPSPIPVKDNIIHHHWVSSHLTPGLVYISRKCIVWLVKVEEERGRVRPGWGGGVNGIGRSWVIK